MAVKEILSLGNPKLYDISAPVEPDELPFIKTVVQDLHDTMLAFREKYRAGRAIAAPQLGVMKRVIYMHIDAPVVLLNPVYEFKSDEMFELWDDCMCFPEMLVKVRRHRYITLSYYDLDWKKQTASFSDDLSELLQHEYDHLDGMLAVSRAIDGRSFALRSEVELPARIG
ncbi:MAG: formylmethionine deformylase [[Candidatus Thermochlorobacteriaceae] bacterium GBChlB]|nr:MAG: formylmethionine deformylase [[Candidatus Thermochlorobacteriaceae] bacterium GBChlB]